MGKIPPDKLPGYIKKLENWIEEREKVLDYSIEQYDKLIITLSSGGLVLTVGFVRDIVKITPCTDTTNLQISWCLFTAALIISLLSHITSYLANKYEIDYTNEEINCLKKKEEFKIKGFNIKKISFLKKFFNSGTIILNVLSSVSLAIGIILFVIFINKNL
jgi:hypothetical protein